MKIDHKAAFDAVRTVAPGIWNVPGTVAAMDALLAMAEGGDVFPISAIDAALLQVAMPAKSQDELAPWVEPIRDACRQFEINTIRRVAAFLTTLAHEGGFVVGKRENMNYSAKRLSEVWPSRFAQNGFRGQPNALARSLEGKPEALANSVYAGRMGNGDAASGDGWRFRGNGPPQLTGRDNHEAFAKAMAMPVEQATAWIGTIEGGVMAAAWFWDVNDINRLADTPGVSDETRRINGGEIGLAARKAIFDRLVSELLKREKSK